MIVDALNWISETISLYKGEMASCYQVTNEVWHTLLCLFFSFFFFFLPKNIESFHIPGCEAAASTKLAFNADFVWVQKFTSFTWNHADFSLCVNRQSYFKQHNMFWHFLHSCGPPCLYDWLHPLASLMMLYLETICGHEAGSLFSLLTPACTCLLRTHSHSLESYFKAFPVVF